MKKLLSLLILPVLALVCLVGCKGDKNPKDIENYYKQMKSEFIVEEENIFFADEERPNTISIAYNDRLNNYIKNVEPSTDLQRRYVALGVQQEILNDVFNFYENNQEDFYREMSSAEYKQSELNDLYSSLENLKKTLSDFKTQYTQFMSDFESEDIMTFSVLSYTYQLNKVIDSSFDFIYNFMNLFDKYCIDGEKVTTVTLNYSLDCSYVDIANVVYLQNIKPFNYSVGEKGVCDLLPIISEGDNRYNLVNYLGNTEHLSSAIISGMDSTLDAYPETMDKINNFIYFKGLMGQRIDTFRSIMNSIDDYTLNEYRFNLVNGVDYDTYLVSLSASNRANVEALDRFIEDIFKEYIEKLELITE